LICTDIDGTLHSSHHEIPEETIGTLKRLAATRPDLPLLLATGKAPIPTWNIAAKLPNPHIYSVNLNGCIICKHGVKNGNAQSGISFVYDKALDKGIVLHFLAVAKERNWCSIIFSYDETLSFSTAMKHLSVLTDFKEPLPKLHSYESLTQSVESGVLKAHKVLFIDDSDKIDDIRIELEKGARHFENDYCSLRTQPGIIEMIPSNVSKATALQWICKELDVEMRNIVAFGDSENDLDMLKQVGLGVAVANAFENVKAAADYVTASNDDSGMAKVLQALFNI
jgi:Cof subfamily protein (haloacid dehalogenase superfamily)